MIDEPLIEIARARRLERQKWEAVLATLAQFHLRVRFKGDSYVSCVKCLVVYPCPEMAVIELALGTDKRRSAS